MGEGQAPAEREEGALVSCWYLFMRLVSAEEGQPHTNPELLAGICCFVANGLMVHSFSVVPGHSDLSSSGWNGALFLFLPHH